MPPTTLPAPHALFAGLSTIDLSYLVPEFPLPDQKIAARRQDLCAGGPATNAAVTFAFLGGHSTLLTAVGSHPLGNLIRLDLAAHHVELHDLAPHHDGPPALSSISVREGTGERTVVSANAAAYPPISLAGHPLDPTSASLVLIDGHHPQLCLDLARLAHHHAIPVILDAGSWKPGFDELLPFVHTAICSDDFLPPGAGNEQAIAEFLLHRGVSQIAITRGSRSILWFTPQSRGVHSVPIIHPVDTLGAGDIFHGAYCRAHASGIGFPSALAFAATIATESCLHHGTRSWMQTIPPQTRADWDRFLDTSSHQPAAASHRPHHA